MESKRERGPWRFQVLESLETPGAFWEKMNRRRKGKSEDHLKEREENVVKSDEKRKK